MPRKRFLAAWNRTGGWAIVVLAPGQLPEDIDTDRYLQAVIALEKVGQFAVAEQNYAGVLKREPGNTLARFGMANTLRVEGRLEESVQQYRKLLEYDPGNKPALNNLADTLLRLGRCQEALRINWPGPGDAGVSEIDRALLMTREEIEHSCSRLPAPP
jgi:tetratricopeptide (TPR) repeat protein